MELKNPKKNSAKLLPLEKIDIVAERTQNYP